MARTIYLVEVKGHYITSIQRAFTEREKAEAFVIANPPTSGRGWSKEFFIKECELD